MDYLGDYHLDDRNPSGLNRLQNLGFMVEASSHLESMSVGQVGRKQREWKIAGKKP